MAEVLKVHLIRNVTGSLVTCECGRRGALLQDNHWANTNGLVCSSLSECLRISEANAVDSRAAESAARFDTASRVNEDALRWAD